MAQAFDGLAQSIAAEPGFLFRYRAEDSAGGRSGGIYAFGSRADAEA